MQTSRRVHQDHIALARLPRRDGVEDDGRRVGTGTRLHEIRLDTPGPNLELLDGGRPERIGRADDGSFPGRGEQPRQPADRRGLAGPVHAHDEHDPRSPTGHLRGSGRLEHTEHLALDDRPQVLLPGLVPDGVDQTSRRRETEVRLEQDLFQRVQGVDGCGHRAARRFLVGLHGIEAADQLVCGSLETDT